MAVDSKQIAEQISDVLKNSPANTQRPEVKKIVDAIKRDPNEGAMIQALRNVPAESTEPVGAMIEAMRRNSSAQTETPEEPPVVPVIDLAGLYGSSASAKHAEDIAKLSGPIDKSTGIDFDERGTATKNIATDRTLGTEGTGGADDYAQYEYDLGNTRGAPSSGVYEDDVYVRNLRAGNAGLNIATSSTLNPINGSDGNPAMFGRRYPKLNTTVEPFKVRIPDYNLEVVSETLDPEKLAYQVATSIAGRPVPTYVGYTNVGFDITEPWYSTLTKGIGRAPIALVGMVGDAAIMAPTFAAAGLPLADALAAYIGGADSKEVRDMLNRELGAIATTYDDIAGGWGDAIDGLENYLGLKNTSKAGTTATIVGEVPTIAGQIGLLWAVGALAAGSGLSLEASTALSSVVGGGVFGLAQGSEEFEELGRKGVSPMVRFRNATAGTAGSIALESLGLLATFSSKMAAARQFMKNYSKRQWLAGVEGAVFGMAGEGATEWGDQVLQDYVTYNMGDDQAMNRLNTRTMAFVLGAVGGLAGVPAHVFNERVQIAREAIKKAKIAADSPQWLKELDTAVNMVASQGVYTKEQALDMIVGMASPEGQKYLNQKQNDTLMGLLDRITPEAAEYVRNLGAKKSAAAIDTINRIGEMTFNAIPDTVDLQTRTMVANAMRAIAPLIEFRGGKFRMPTFIIRPNEPMKYVPKTNTLYINPNSVGEAIDYKYVQDKSLPLLDSVQRGILHELGHMLDAQLGKGTNYKEFFPAYFEAISKVFGKEKAMAVKSAMPDEANRLEYATSNKKKDVSEKMLAQLTGDISDKNTSEYFAYALGRLGKRIGKAFGFTGSEVAEYIDAANIMAMTLQIPRITEQLTAYQNAMNSMIKNNDETLAAIAKAAGENGLAQKVREFAAGKTDALSREDVLALYKILNEYVGVDGMKILDDAFKDVQVESFMQRVEREFKNSIRQTGRTVGDIQAAAKKKLEAESDRNTTGTNVNEQVVYVSTPVPLEGENLDVDKYYASGEAAGRRGRAMRWGYGNYGSKSPDLNKRYYFDEFLSRASVARSSRLTNKNGEIIKEPDDYRYNGIAAWLETQYSETKDTSLTKKDIEEKISKEIKTCDDNEKSEEKRMRDIEAEALKNPKIAAAVDDALSNGIGLDDTVQTEATRTGGLYMLTEYLNDPELFLFKYPQLDNSTFRDGIAEFLDSGLRMQLREAVDGKIDAQLRKNAWQRDYDYIEKSFPDEATLVIPKASKLEPHQYAFLVPDKEYYLDAQKPISQQTKYVRDRIQQVADKYDYWNSEYVLNPESGAYDIDVDSLTGEEFYDWLAYTVYPETIGVEPRDFGNFDNVDANRFARDVLADTGIKGMRAMGHRDEETYNTFLSKDTKKYKQIREDTFDVSEILNDKKQRVSALEKRVAEKPTGYDYETDVKNVTDIMQKSGKAPKWFAKMFGGGDMNTALWSMGGQSLVDYFGMIPKMNRASDYATSKMEEFDNIVKKELGFKNNVERDAFMNQASIDSIDVEYMIDPLTGDPISGKISPLVAMNVYLHSLNPKTRINMLNAFGGNGDQMQKVIDALTPEQKKYADLMQKFVADNWKEYKRSYQQEGEDIDDTPYWPVVEAVHAAMGERKTNSNISRKGDESYAISLAVDAREIFNTYVQRVAGAKNDVYSTIRRMKDLFGYNPSEQTDDYPTGERTALSNKMADNTRKLRGMAIRNIGEERRFDQFLELQNDFLAKREAMQVGSESLNIAARNLTAGLLQWKPIQFIKNLSNASGYWGAADNQAQYWKDTAWAATHPIEAAKYMFEKVPFLRNRFKGQNIDEALTQQTAGTDSLLMNWAKKTDQMSADGKQIVSNIVALTQAARRLGYTPMLSGDMAANIVGGYGLLKQFETKYGDRAADKFAEFIVNHQTSSNQATRSLLQRRWSRDIRGELTRFATEQVQKAKSIGTAIAQVQRGERTAGNAAKEIASTLSSILIFSLISAGVIDLFDGDEENDKEVYEALGREGISAIVGGSVIGNSIIAPIIDSLFFGTSGGMGTPASKIVMSDLRKLSKGEYEDAILDSIGSTIPLVGAKSFANSAKGVYRMVTAEDSKELKAGTYQALGRSENYANKRAGIKKEKQKK